MANELVARAFEDTNPLGEGARAPAGGERRGVDVLNRLGEPGPAIAPTMRGREFPIFSREQEDLENRLYRNKKGARRVGQERQEGREAGGLGEGTGGDIGRGGGRGGAEDHAPSADETAARLYAGEESPLVGLPVKPRTLKTGPYTPG